MRMHSQLNSDFERFHSSSSPFEIHYKGQEVGKFIPDLIVFDQIEVDTKTIDRIGDHERGQILNYLKITNLNVGVILNFKNPKLEWERLVL